MVFKSLIIPLFLCSSLSFSEEPELRNPLTGFETAKTEVPDPHGFLGETLEYDISWGIMLVGKAYIKVERAVKISTGVYAYHIVSGARSTRFLQNFYPVKDLNEALLDVNLAGSYGYYKKISEGSYKRSEWVFYDVQNRKFRGEKLRKGRKTEISGDLETGNVFDILSALYFFRTRDSKEKESYDLKVNTQKNWNLTVKNHGKEKIKTPAGKYRCHVLEPMVGEEGIFAPKKGKRLLVYVSENERLPVMLKAEVFIGSVTAKLAKIKRKR
ncbi:MAG: hypothetical protein COT17_06040 [Elusimicrobia bacterium CG08_land_8_20_14_0_20_51_18]|nr:MAG: hypothetical protein COT17_06040 [Elusimicrobia bacterium CG08_land_8_20_14_0_20_51_18]